MNAVLQPSEARFEPMAASWFEAVLRVENSAYDHPWSRGNFSDSLNAGYQAQVLTGGAEGASELLGYFVAMMGVDEVHLLNITVAPEHQRQGWARVMLDALVLWSRGQGALWLWLEVRVSNERARAVYEHYGFRHVGTRRQYYPAANGQREDAVVMSLGLS
ncbi:MAG: ribosomal protein S18-alanine N-acetyltransferase [Polaromonas sp.]|nr:ribosomal protein S18-alanine N-acetyltransferase [Polaromonas sp.]